MKVIIAGGRDFDNYNLLEHLVEGFIMSYGFPLAEVEIVSGHANGADSLGELYGYKKHLKVSSFLANWNKYGKQAGAIRNKEMAEYATHCICFWDGKSKGTKMMIDIATKKGLEVQVFNY